MPKNAKGRKIMKAMKEQYGKDKGEEVFYASLNKGTIKGVEKKAAFMAGFLSKCAEFNINPHALLRFAASKGMNKSAQWIQIGGKTYPNSQAAIAGLAQQRKEQAAAAAAAQRQAAAAAEARKLQEQAAAENKPVTLPAPPVAQQPKAQTMPVKPAPTAPVKPVPPANKDRMLPGESMKDYMNRTGVTKQLEERKKRIQEYEQSDEAKKLEQSRSGQ